MAISPSALHAVVDNDWMIDYMYVVVGSCLVALALGFSMAAVVITQDQKVSFIKLRKNIVIATDQCIKKK